MPWIGQCDVIWRTLPISGDRSVLDLGLLQPMSNTDYSKAVSYRLSNQAARQVSISSKYMGDVVPT